MTRRQLESFQVNKRLIENNRQKIEQEQCKDIPAVKGKVKGSSHEFPYTERRFTVEMGDPTEVERSYRKIAKWKSEIRKAETEMQEVENFISNIAIAKDKEILTYRYLDGMKTVQIAKKLNYTHGRISQIISKYVKD